MRINEYDIIKRIDYYSALVERVTKIIEKFSVRGYSINSPEIRQLKLKLFDLEKKSDYWRRKLYFLSLKV